MDDKGNDGIFEISALGKFGFIDRLTADIKVSSDDVLRGIGDDAAVLSSSARCRLVATNSFVEGIHFNLIYTPLKHLGYKAVVANLSNLYAMNAVPRYVTVSLALSRKFTVRAVEELYVGIKMACSRFDVDIIGGDTTGSLSGLFINVTAIGEADRNDIVYRSGASANDLVCVSGDLGGAYLGLQLLEREKEVYLSDTSLQPELAGNEYIIERQLKPEPRRDIVEALRRHNIRPTSMIDVSDGLASDMLQLCKASSLGCAIFEDKLPIHPDSVAAADRFHLDPSLPALNGGEDFELLFTVPLAQKDAVAAVADVSVIGYMAADVGRKVFVPRNGAEMDLVAQGWHAIK